MRVSTLFSHSRVIILPFKSMARCRIEIEHVTFTNLISFDREGHHLIIFIHIFNLSSRSYIAIRRNPSRLYLKSNKIKERIFTHVFTHWQRLCSTTRAQKDIRYVMLRAWSAGPTSIIIRIVIWNTHFK